MKSRILREPGLFLGLIVWAMAVTVFPLQLGLAGAAILSLVAYVAIAGTLLAVADAVLNPAFYNRTLDVVLQAAFWTMGIALPALAAFTIGGMAAPAQQAFTSDLCALGGLEGPGDPDDRTDTALEDALEAMNRCPTPD